MIMAHCDRKRVGATETQDLVLDHDFPDINNECESEQRSRKSGVPATLFRDDRFIRQFALALLNRQFAHGKIGRNSFTGVFRCEPGAIGIDRSSCEGAAEQIAQPAKDGGQHLMRTPRRATTSDLGDESYDGDIVRDIFWLQRRLDCTSYIGIRSERHQTRNKKTQEDLQARPKDCHGILELGSVPH